MVAAVYDRLSRIGVRVPDDAGITGYDAAPVRGLFSRAITTVDLSVEDLGRQAEIRIERKVVGPLLPGETL